VFLVIRAVRDYDHLLEALCLLLDTLYRVIVMLRELLILAPPRPQSPF